MMKKMAKTINKKEFIVSIFTLFLPLTLFANTKNIGITEDQVIGHAPQLIENADKYLSFSYDGKHFYSELGNHSVLDNYLPILKFNDFTTQALSDDVYLDLDGDLKADINAITTQSMRLSWKDSTGKPIARNDMDKTLGCDEFAGPYALTITANNIHIKSKYGNPSSNTVAILNKEYTINVGPGVCGIKPTNLDWYDGQTFNKNSGNTTPTMNGGGYTADFDPIHGFKYQPTLSAQTFPTIGYPDARFIYDMSGGATQYTWSIISNPGNAVTLDRTKGEVILISKPSGSIVIRASHIASGKDFDYRFTINKWIVPSGSDVSFREAAEYCRYYQKIKLGIDGPPVTSDEIASTYLPERSIFTNSPQTSADENWDGNYNVGTRAIDGSLFAEWGNVADNYAYGQWSWSTYFTAGQWKPNYFYTVAVSSGSIIPNSFSHPTMSKQNVACLL